MPVTWGVATKAIVNSNLETVSWGESAQHYTINKFLYLRALLSVNFGKGMVGRENKDIRYSVVLQFVDSSTAKCDVLVGCDEVNSAASEVVPLTSKPPHANHHPQTSGLDRFRHRHQPGGVTAEEKDGREASQDAGNSKAADLRRAEDRDESGRVFVPHRPVWSGGACGLDFFVSAARQTAETLKNRHAGGGKLPRDTCRQRAECWRLSLPINSVWAASLTEPTTHTLEVETGYRDDSGRHGRAFPYLFMMNL
ncbi:hypothetical protein CHU98_g6178 [Xylaria longipes]|nr:hypothetical protein CHU98_g6178 [Xylaria longipes]